MRQSTQRRPVAPSGEGPAPAVPGPSLSPGPRQQTARLFASLVIAALVTAASVLGLLTTWAYAHETENWLLQARGQDIGNLIAAAVLVVGAIRMGAGSSRAAEIWLGTQFYLLYAYIVYAFAVHFGRLFLVYVAVLGLVVFTLIAALRLGTPRPVAGLVARRLAGWTLIGVGGLFALLWLSELVPATLTGQAPPSLGVAGLIVNPIHVIDLAVVLPGMIAVGVLTLRGDGLGSTLTVPALWFSVLMGSSIIAAMMLILASGDTGVMAPMTMVVVVVGASLVAMLAYARSALKPPAQRAARRPMHEEA